MSDEIVICEHCDNESESLTTVGNTECCNSCIESFPQCFSCEKKTIETTTVENNEYCEDCYNELPYCSHCEETVTEVDEHNHCPDCEDNYCSCSRCYDNVSVDSVVYDSCDEAICPSCQEDGTIPEDDDYWYHYDDLTYSERDGCYFAHRTNSGGIQEYHSAPRQKIEGSFSGKYVGFELEVVPLQDRDTVAESLISKIENIVCENDGSIDCDNHEYEEDGFEVISNYGELDKVLEIASKVVDELDNKAVSFEAGCCGLHVHVSRVQDVYNNAKFVVFWNDSENWNFLKQFTHRDNSCWARRKTDKNKGMLKSSSGSKTYNYFIDNDDKYELVRVCDRTVEIRGFKGTLHKPRLLACIELAYYTYEYCKLDICVDKLDWKDFMEWLPEESKYIRSYFETRKDKIKELENIVKEVEEEDRNIVNHIPQPITGEITLDRPINNVWTSYNLERLNQNLIIPQVVGNNSNPF